MPPESRLQQKRSQNAAQTQHSPITNSKCRRIKPEFDKTGAQNATDTPASAKPHSKCRLNPDVGKTDLKVPPQARLGQGRTQTFAPSPTSAKPNPKCRLNPDLCRTALKMTKQIQFRQNRMLPKPGLRQNQTQKASASNRLRQAEPKAPCQARTQQNRSQNAAASILASAKPKSKDRRTKPDFGKTELIMPPKPLQRQSRPQNVADTPSKSLRQNRTHNATAPSPIWAKPSSKCRGIKPDFGKTKHKMPRRQAQLGKTKHKMPPKPRLR